MREIDSQQETLSLGLTMAGGHAGFRLERFEVLNWGTFHGRVWNLQLNGENALLTGDIGSGKSTFVDAITTLLVPPAKITFNKAAGAEARERSVRSYLFGHYKAERGESGGSVRAVALRDQSSYAVILGRFYNADLDRHVTLAQVFWSKDPQEQPSRLYVAADMALGIQEHFTGFGADVRELRKRLRQLNKVELFDTFPPYGAAYRRSFGIDSDQAMDLFNQTVSMKSVGNLTDFVRDHMLEAFDVESRIAALNAHFEDLNRAHETVLKAQRQIRSLVPLVESCNERAGIAGGLETLVRCREALHAWFSSLTMGLLGVRISEYEIAISNLDVSIGTLAEERRAAASTRDELMHAIARNGGDRIEGIKREIAELERQKGDRVRRAGDYDRAAVQVVCQC